MRRARFVRQAAIGAAFAPFATPLAALGAGSPAAVLDTMLRDMVAQHQLPSLVAGAIRGGSVILSKTYGTISLPSGPPPDAQTVYAIGSVSKSLTALGVLVLVDQGKVSLDAAIATYMKALPPSWQSITVRQFMTMTSGIPDFPRLDITLAGMMARMASRALQFPPGTQQKYTNSNFAVMGALIETVSGMPYMEFMRANVLQPLGMTSTGPYTQFQGRGGNVATGYVLRNGTMRPGLLDIKQFGIPSGGLMSTLDDMTAFVQGVLEGKLFSPATYTQMYTRTIPPDARGVWHFTPGWQARVSNGIEVVAKNGGVTGFSCMVQLVPAQRTGIVMIWNQAGDENFMWQQTAQMLNSAFGVPLAVAAAPAEPD